MYLVFATCAGALAIVIAINIFIMVVKIYSRFSAKDTTALSAGFEKKKVILTQILLLLLTLVYNLILVSVLYASFIWLD